MILILNNNSYVVAYNKKRAKESVDTSRGEVWYDGDFEFGMGEDIEGKVKRYKWNGAEVEIEYFDVPIEHATPEPSQLDRIEQQVNNIANGATAEATEVMDALLGVE